MTEEQFSGDPFHPGTGSEPDHLAGREPEQALLRKALRAITGPREWYYGPLRSRAPRPLKIIGPRGAGKMALLDWARHEAEALGADVVRLTHQPNADSEDVLAEFKRELDNVPGLRKIEAQTYKYLQMAWNWPSGQTSMRNFKETLEARLRFRPLLVVLDDVIHYDMAMLNQVLNQYQLLASDRWPLALVLVGTSALDWHLVDTKAAFINRAENIRINSLDSDATHAALSKPFADRGVTVSDEALDLMASWTDNYPYFIQIVGRKVWEAQKADGCTEVDVALVQSTEQAVQKERGDFYGSIYRMINTAELQAYAMKAVTAIEAAPEPLMPGNVRDCIAEGTGLNHEGALKIYSQLLDAGLFWEINNLEVHAAIPSFFNYFKEEYKRKHPDAR